MIGIYKITNKINNKSYIGQSIHIEERWKQHINLITTGEQLLYKAFRKYGINNFNFEVIELCPQTQLNEREIYWSQHYNTLTPNGYNMVECGDSPSGENNPNSKYSTADIYNLRKRVYLDYESPENVLQDY